MASSPAQLGAAQAHALAPPAAGARPGAARLGPRGECPERGGDSGRGGADHWPAAARGLEPNDAYGKMEAEDGREHEPNGRLPLAASVCDPTLANLPCAPAVVAAAAAALGALQG